MLLSSLFPLTGLALCTSAQGTVVPYTEAQSGITVTAYVSPNYVFGVALPTTPSNDFIGVMIGKGTGWVGVSLGGQMKQNLLLATWPNGNDILASFRKTNTYASPPVASGTFQFIPIANGTYANSTHFVSTFLCLACLSDDGSTFTLANATGKLGWAFSSAAPITKASNATTFSKHNSQGSYVLDLASAKSDDYATWAGYAGNSTSAGVERKFKT